MRTFVLLSSIVTLLATIHSQSCPQDPIVGNPINYVHLFKEQTDSDWNFYNTQTVDSLVYMDSVVTAGITVQRIVLRITNSNLPVRQWLYMVQVTYDVNLFISQITYLGRVRSTGVAATDLTLIRAFFNDVTIVLATAGTCCLSKLEYINFYYLFSNYYKNGLGTNQPTCV